jgi:hypothetical protein
LKLILGGGKFKKVSCGLMWGRAEFKGDMLQKDTSLANLYWHGFHLHTNRTLDLDNLVVLLNVLNEKLLETYPNLRTNLIWEFKKIQNWNLRFLLKPKNYKQVQTSHKDWMW